MSATSVESVASVSTIEITYAGMQSTMQTSMQSRRMRIGDDESSGLAQKKSKGKWRPASRCPVLLEMAHCRQSKEDKLIIVPQKTELDKSPQPSDSPQPVRTEVAVENDRLSVYGALRAKKDNNEIDIVLERPDSTNKDLSYQFNYYIWDNPEEDSGPTKPPKFVLFESLFYGNCFICWDLEKQTAQCKHLPLAPDMLIEDLDSHIDNDQIQKFVWVIPVNDDENQFALKTYGESHFLAFERTGDAILVPGASVNPEVTIFTFDVWS